MRGILSETLKTTKVNNKSLQHWPLYEADEVEKPKLKG